MFKALPVMGKVDLYGACILQAMDSLPAADAILHRRVFRIGRLKVWFL
jgi:hypothetical protein